MTRIFILALSLFLFVACNVKKERHEEENAQMDESTLIQKTPVIFDTDANNELDDQHALAYLLFNAEVFLIKGVTVNATKSGGDIEHHYKEAQRIIHLCKAEDIVPLKKGANGAFVDIEDHVMDSLYDGMEAVEFIINEARKQQGQKLILLPVGKLTNIALALKKAPDIKNMVRIVWLGSNYPDPGEYNLENDIPAMNYILDQDVQFEMVMVRYGEDSGSDAVKVTPEMMEKNMKGAGPEATAIEGRHGGEFTHFGDYSIDLFHHIDLYGDPPSRALFDMVAVAIVKNSNWGDKIEIQAPIMENEQWKDRPDNGHTIFIWENFKRERILADFFETMQHPSLLE